MVTGVIATGADAQAETSIKAIAVITFRIKANEANSGGLAYKNARNIIAFWSSAILCAPRDVAISQPRRAAEHKRDSTYSHQTL